MTLDIREGDILILEGAAREYPIRAVEEWPWEARSSQAFRRRRRVRAFTKRASVTSGVSSAPVAYLTDLDVLQLTPVDADTQARPTLRGFQELKETYLDGGTEFYRLVLEVVK